MDTSDAIEYITELGLPINELNVTIAKTLQNLEDGYLFEFWYDQLQDPSAWNEKNLRDIENDVVRSVQERE